MLSNSISAQGRPQIIGRDRQPVNIYSISSSRELSFPGRGYRAISSPVGYFFSEHIWANLLLAATVFLSVAYPGREGERTMASSLNGLVKRGIDILGSVVGLILTAPFFVLLPIIIKLESPGPVFYMQSRVGHNRRKRDRRGEMVSSLCRSHRDRRRSDLLGSPFKVIKFRTMVADAEKKCGPVWATKNDPRITRVGLFLRKTRLDEIPQFINIFMGQMSLVGPRPERPMFVKELCTQVENYDRRLEVKPGLTGLAQIENGYDSSVASVVRKVHYDLQYIQNFSIWQDVKIMLKTVVVVVTGKGAF
jgi:lipopolysaccharide/colanic/teichoic acid biosynthesis glycosyltransferase